MTWRARLARVPWTRVALASAAAVLALAGWRFWASFARTAPGVGHGRAAESERAPEAAFDTDPLPADGSPLVGDPRHGARLFALHCIACHGLDGAGRGPSGEVLHPPPRDLTDPIALGWRTDAQLVALVRSGGPALGLSRNMPPFGDLVDELSAWDIVAHVRRLQAPRAAILPGDAPLRFARVVLDAERAAEFAARDGGPLAPEERRVDLLLADEPPSAAAAAAPVTIDGRRVVVTVAIDGAGRRTGTHVHAPPGAAAAPEAGHQIGRAHV